MPDIKRQIKLVTEQHVLPDVPSEVEGFPMREWSIEIYVVGPNDEQLPATCFEKVTYRLHESFGKRATQHLKNPPFRIQEQGWGEFDMSIVLQPFSQPKGEQTVFHDLNFQQERYESLQQFTFRNPKPELIERLRESGPVGDANGAPKPEKRKKTSKTGSLSRCEGLIDVHLIVFAHTRIRENPIKQVKHRSTHEKADQKRHVVQLDQASRRAR
ncbi:transcription factor TFIIF complex subunit [Aureobasidium pullulans]|uniref:Transcription factor TFIIF complex subunit n=1 Tax=Aureobasidium pullulans TaxID=5580 RepID=A0A4V6TLZ1_AURPU|nr:transcription factor TFIIF complex subunit [Aureobasidium pullulans]